MGRPSCRAVVLATARVTGIAAPYLYDRHRVRHISEARQLAYVACREIVGATLPRIGEALGRDHTTVLHGITVAKARPETAALVAAVRADLAERAALLSPIPAVPPAGCRVHTPPQGGAADSPERRASLRSGDFSIAEGAP